MASFYFFALKCRFKDSGIKVKLGKVQLERNIQPEELGSHSHWSIYHYRYHISTSEGFTFVIDSTKN